MKKECGLTESIQSDSIQIHGLNPEREKLNSGEPLLVSSKQHLSNQLALPKENQCSDQVTMSTVNENITVSTSSLQIAVVHFKVGEIVWAKIKGSPAWPAKILSFPSNKMALVEWFNDYRKTKIYRTQMHKFLVNFDRFAEHFDKSVGLHTAAREALHTFGNSLINE